SGHLPLAWLELCNLVPPPHSRLRRPAASLANTGVVLPVSNARFIVNNTGAIIDTYSVFYVSAGRFTVAALVVFFALATQTGVQVAACPLVLPDMQVDTLMANQALLILQQPA